MASITGRSIAVEFMEKGFNAASHGEAYCN